MRDTDIEMNMKVIDQAIEAIKKAWDTGQYDKLVISEKGIGTGLAKLPETAPMTWKYLEGKSLPRLFEYVNNNKVGEC